MTSDMQVKGGGAPVRVLVVDDDLVVRKGLASLLTTDDGRIVVVGEARDGSHALDLAHEHTPDVALLDLNMPLYDGLYALPELSKICKVLMLTNNDAPLVVDQALRAGARGYLVHRQFNAAELVASVLATATGRAHLSPSAINALADNLRSMRSTCVGVSGGDRGKELSRRELEIMEHIARGMSNPEIARILFLSEKTVKNHVNRIYAKLQVRTRAAAVALWLGADVTEVG
ncbi:response regulator [Streptomyces sp. NPDC002573]|uniref:response regulator n=1 Tax=Streptomyces sp. NPDC002573 TaxID=3364651 RepID=UPI0036A5DC8B